MKINVFCSKKNHNKSLFVQNNYDKTIYFTVSPINKSNEILFALHTIQLIIKYICIPLLNKCFYTKTISINTQIIASNLNFSFQNLIKDIFLFQTIFQQQTSQEAFSLASLLIIFPFAFVIIPMRVIVYLLNTVL